MTNVNSTHSVVHGMIMCFTKTNPICLKNMVSLQNHDLSFLQSKKR